METSDSDTRAIAGKPAPPSNKRLSRITKLGNYALWTALGAVLPLFVDRILVHPALSRELGTELFGGFIWVLGIVNLFGSTGAAGFATPLMRDYASHTPAQAGLTYRCSLLLSVVISGIVLSTAAILIARAADDTVHTHAWSLFVPLVTFGVLRAASLILTTNLRIHRRFPTIFMMQAIESAVLCANLLVAPSRSLWLVGFIYVASMVATLPFAAWKVDDIQVKASWWDGPTARLLVAGWLPGALINVFNTSQIYLSRLAVGVFADTTEVAVLYAGIAISSIFVMPVTILAQLVLSLLGGTNRFVLPYPRALVYYVGVLTFSIVVSLASWLAGRWLIELLYPDVAARTMTFYHWIAISNGCASLMMMLRSVAIKYAPLGKTTFWTGIVLVVQIAALLVLVPRMQSAGAAVAVALSALVSAVIWSVYFFWIVSYYGRSAEST